WAVNSAIIDTAFAHIGHDGSHSGVGNFFPQFWGQDGAWVLDTGGLLGTTGFFGLDVVNFGAVAKIGQGEVCFGDIGHQTSSRWCVLGLLCINFNFVDVSRLGSSWACLCTV